MKKAFLDTNVLIAAWQGEKSYASKALSLIEDEKVEFVASSLSRLELVSQPKYHRQKNEVAFYELFFSRVTHWITIDEPLVEMAAVLAATHGLHAMDALHVAVALAGGAEEFVTTEGPTKPLHRVKKPKVVWLPGI